MNKVKTIILSVSLVLLCLFIVSSVSAGGVPVNESINSHDENNLEWLGVLGIFCFDHNDNPVKGVYIQVYDKSGVILKDELYTNSAGYAQYKGGLFESNKVKAYFPDGNVYTGDVNCVNSYIFFYDIPY